MFYHLTRSSAEDTLRLLLPRALAQGWRVMLRGTDRGRLEALDLALWRVPEDGFLPHGMDGGPHDAAQPVLLGTGAIGNGAQALMLLDGAETDAAEAAPLERVWILFDGLDEGQLVHARGQWKALTGAGLKAQYWSEESGRWEKKAEAGQGAAGAERRD
ncbi:DNA polymerase III subunit chi [Cereibacter azotoformans]|uniref:DNA polymerase III subunit chi n=1 Tax=Cereibacter azotoformans TaxID=43057 RepID=UPI003B224484